MEDPAALRRTAYGRPPAGLDAEGARAHAAAAAAAQRRLAELAEADTDTAPEPAAADTATDTDAPPTTPRRRRVIAATAAAALLAGTVATIAVATTPPPSEAPFVESYFESMGVAVPDVRRVADWHGWQVFTAVGRAGEPCVAASHRQLVSAACGSERIDLVQIVYPDTFDRPPPGSIGDAVPVAFKYRPGSLTIQFLDETTRYAIDD